MNFKIILLVLGVFALWRDYQRDAGQHRVAKGVHAVFVLALLFSYGGSIGYTLHLFSNFSALQAQYGRPVGAVPGHVHFAIFLLHLATCLVTILLTYQLQGRSAQACQRLFYVLPLLVLTEAFNFHRGWLGSEES